MSVVPGKPEQCMSPKGVSMKESLRLVRHESGNDYSFLSSLVLIVADPQLLPRYNPTFMGSKTSWST